MVEGFDDDILEFVAQELFDGALVLRFDFGVIGQYADGAKIARRRTIGREEFLHGLGGIGVVVEDAFERLPPGAGAGQRLAQAIRSARRLVRCS